MSGEALRRGVGLCIGQLPDVSGGRIRRLLRAGDPAETWASIRAGRPPIDGVGAELAMRWKVESRRLDPADELARHTEAGVGVAAIDDADYPAALVSDRDAPGIVAWRGDASAINAPAVAIVGTRRCTRYGRDVAFELGAELAAAGVVVVSGLALGIDGAAHSGAISIVGAPPVAVIAGVLDRIYPRRHRTLWDAVAERGAVIAEAPLGVAPEAWRFPARNRIIAALADVTVVVESGRAGGSMHTVREADDRGRMVMAVPGSVRSAASDGTNQLLSEGCPPCRDADDVLVALGLARPGHAAASSVGDSLPGTPDELAVIDALSVGPSSLDQLVLRTGLQTSTLSLAVEELTAAGRVVARDGWFEVAS